MLRVWLGGFSVLLLSVLATSCADTSARVEPTKLVVGTVWPGAAWDRVGQALARAYSERVPNVTATAQPSGNLDLQVAAFERGDVNLAILDVETAYLARGQESGQRTTPGGALRAVAVLFSTAVQIVVRSDTGIFAIKDLRGRRVSVGAKDSPTARAAQLILESHGVPFDSVQAVFGAEDPAGALRARTLDALVLYSPFQNPLIAQMAGAEGVRLIPVRRDTLGTIEEQHHFLKSTTIPGGTYKDQDDDVLTVGMDVLLVCREDLPEPLVYDLARTLFESVPVLREAHASAAGIDVERGPTAAIPLHPGAARYYREREILR